MLHIISFDNIDFYVNYNTIKSSSFITNLINNNNETIFLNHESCDSITLKKTLEFLNKQTTNFNFFNSIDEILLFKLLLISNYLDIDIMLNAISKYISNFLLKHKTVKEIKNCFNINNDISLEENNEFNFVF